MDIWVPLASMEKYPKIKGRGSIRSILSGYLLWIAPNNNDHHKVLIHILARLYFHYEFSILYSFSFRHLVHLLFLFFILHPHHHLFFLEWLTRCDFYLYFLLYKTFVKLNLCFFFILFSCTFFFFLYLLFLSKQWVLDVSHSVYVNFHGHYNLM